MAKLTRDQIAYLNRLSPATDANLGDILDQICKKVWPEEHKEAEAVKEEAPAAEEEVTEEAAEEPASEEATEEAPAAEEAKE